MFGKIERTNFPPQNPTMVWDGECGFCKYWIIHWKSKTEDRVTYITFQEIAAYFEDIPLKKFKKASRLIEPSGKIYSGPDSAYRSFTYFKNPKHFLHNLYHKQNWFTWLSDHTYNFIAKHRPIMFTMSKILFGKDPLQMKPYWFLILLFLAALLYFFYASAFITKF
ncbi:thiol-disulfide oxidoreductase DCC family protein [Aequorivita echinoideorum]|uniref:DUF393 domain-containing protein n=1 Tax=Aequorivita echinoideorum TaxID=1549647 RepID=A0ABS5S4N1_9FLAO|nr:DCC1-like thiol-disulfide oxidoreductase family protein [Aequorivita echinoideorum]MBT0607349.1 DUF393 domain-containing protein [Aequorivita echinoideorum]